MVPGAIDPDYGVRLARLQKGASADPKRTLTVVVLGSSRVYYGLVPEALDGPLSRQLGRPVSVLNFGQSGAGGVSQLMTWRRLRRDGVRPDLILVEAWPRALDEVNVPAEFSEDRMPAGRLRWFDLPLLRRYHFVRPHLTRDVALAEINALYSRRLWVIQTVAPDLLPGAPAAISSLTERLTPPPLAGMTPERMAAIREDARQNLAPCMATIAVGGRGYEALRELLRSCREAGVPAALLVMPEGPSLRGWYAPETWATFRGRLEQFGRESGALVVDAREWIEEDDFLDSYHLLPRGAEKFSERLGEELVPCLPRR